MSTTTTPERHGSRFDSRRRPRRGTPRTTGRPAAKEGAGTLEDLIVATMDEVGSAGFAACPVCAEPRLAPSGCSGCGSHLS